MLKHVLKKLQYHVSCIAYCLVWILSYLIYCQRLGDTLYRPSDMLAIIHGHLVNLFSSFAFWYTALSNMVKLHSRYSNITILNKTQIEFETNIKCLYAKPLLPVQFTSQTIYISPESRIENCVPCDFVVYEFSTLKCHTDISYYLDDMNHLW